MWRRSARYRADIKIEMIFAGFNRHHNFFPGRIAGTFTQAIDRAF